MLRNYVLAALALCVSLAPRDRASAAPLSPGDIVVSTQSSGVLYRINPITGATTPISSGGLLFDPFHVIIDPQGRVLTSERTKDPEGIVRTDPGTGTQSLLAPISFPTGLAFEGSNLIAGNFGRDLIRVNLQNGSQSTLTTLNTVSSVQDIEVDSAGQFVILDFGQINSGGGKIIRYNPANNQQVTVTSSLFNPADLVIHPSGDYIVSNGTAIGTDILRINPISGAQQLIAELPNQGFIALENSNSLLFAYNGLQRGVTRINLTTGQSQGVSSFDFHGDITGVAVYVPEPSALPLFIAGVVGASGLRFVRSRQVRTIRPA